MGTLSPNGSMNESIGLEIALHNLLSASMDALPDATKSDIAPASVSHTVAPVHTVSCKYLEHLPLL